MDWKKLKSKFNGKMTKERWLFLLLLGVLLMILSFPFPGSGTKKKALVDGGDNQVGLWAGQEHTQAGSQTDGQPDTQEGDGGSEETLSAWAGAGKNTKGVETSYETSLEARIRELLKSVDGVGQVDVLVLLKSSGEKVLRVDRSSNSTTTKEQDSAGGQREASSSQSEESTVLSGSSGQTGSAPIIEKELSPEISGIIISAQGGGSPAIKEEISQAMEALFGLPAHKIKVLKRVE